MSKTVLNKIARRPPRVIISKAVLIYKTREGGIDHQRWIDVHTTLKEGDKLVLEVAFDDFNQDE